MARRRLLVIPAAAIVPLALAACGPDEEEPGDGSGGDRGGDTRGRDGDGGGGDDTGRETGGEIPPDEDCAEATKLVYVVDWDRTLFRFNPRVADVSAFERVGTIECDSGGEPNSMAVGRDGFAYVLFGNTNPLLPDSYECTAVNQVSIDDARCLGPTRFVCGAEGFEKFGMGYATNGPDTHDETLFIGNSFTGTLAGVDIGSGAVSVVGDLPATGPEFTGNAIGELWAYFPYTDPPQAMHIDKGTAEALESLDLSLLPSAEGALEAAWAWAFWGGSFYIFYYVNPPDPSTTVYKLERDGTISAYIEDTGFRIVGAGVSTCAPVVII